MSDTLSLDQLEQLLETMAPAEIRARYGAALAANPRCESMLRHFEQIDEQLAALADAESAPPLPDFAALLAERAAAEPKVVPLPARRNSLRWLVMAGPIAAALVVALLIGSFWRGENELLRMPAASTPEPVADQAEAADPEEAKLRALREETVRLTDEMATEKDQILAERPSERAASLEAEVRLMEAKIERSRANGTVEFQADGARREEDQPSRAGPMPKPAKPQIVGPPTKDGEPGAKTELVRRARSADEGADVGGATPVEPEPTGSGTISRVQSDARADTVGGAASKAKREPARDAAPRQGESSDVTRHDFVGTPAEGSPLADGSLAEARDQDTAKKESVATEEALKVDAGAAFQDDQVEQQRLAEIAEAEADAPGYQAPVSPRLAQKQIALEGLELGPDVLRDDRYEGSERTDAPAAEIGPLAQLLLTADGRNRAAVAQLGENRARRLTELENAWQTLAEAPIALVTGGEVLWPVFDSKPMATQRWQQAWRASAVASRPAVWIYPRRWQGDRRLVAEIVFGGQTHEVLILFQPNSIELRRP